MIGSVKIALLTNLVAPYRRAAFNALAARAKSVAGSCHVICTDPNETQHIWPTKPVQFHCHPLPGIRVPLGENRRLSFNFGLTRTLLRITPNVLILSGFGPTMWRAQNWAKQHYIPTVLYFDGWHGSDSAYDNIARRFVRRAMIKQADGFIAAGTRGKQWFEAFGVPANHITIAPIPTSFTPPNTDLPDFDQRRFAQRPYDLLWCGRTTTPKGFETFLHTARMLKSQGALRKVGIVGALEPSTVAQQVAALGLSDITDIHPLLPPDQLPEFLTRAKLCLFPSHNDAYGVAVIDAIACGAIVLASTEVGCAVDVMAPAEIHSPDAPADWATACQKLLNDPDNWNQIRRAQSAKITDNTAAHHAAAIWQAADMARHRIGNAA